MSECRVVALASGSGSNFQSILDRTRQPGCPYRVVGLICNRPGAGVLARTHNTGVPSKVVDHQAFADRASFEQAMCEAIDAWHPDLVVLAGFMRILTPAFTHHYRGRLLNIHPSLLPRYPGLNTHRRAIEAGDRQAGASIHFVTEDLDGGPVVCQARVDILDGDTPEALQARVLASEHLIYPAAIEWFARGKLAMKGKMATMDGQSLHPDNIPIWPFEPPA
jgi:phosphoribosylglycinamide formyltransferase-1